jgi:HTH-type transcriptional regulator/antitoxin HigA
MDHAKGPAILVLPGQIVTRELGARGWQQQDLAAIMGRPVQMISEIVNGKKEITPETSRELACAFGTSAEFLDELETNYRLHLAERQQKEDGIRRRQRLFERVPYRELVKRGWIKDNEDIEGQEREVCRFLGISSLDEDSRLALAARRSTRSAPEEAGLLAWARRVEQLVERQQVSAFDASRLESGVEALLEYTTRPEDVIRVPRLLGELGIRFAIVPHLPQTYLDGGAFYHGAQPIVALTLRYDRLDNFWFTLLHELGHIALGHHGVYLDCLDASERVDDEEQDADRWAGEHLISPALFAQFVGDGQLARKRIEIFAAQLHRHPSIVAGRLQHENPALYSRLGRMRVKISPYLAELADVLPS